MEKKKQLSPEDILKLEIPYLELQAWWGATKHVGGLKATRELIELCHIDNGKYVLDVGCGVGITSCYLAKKYDCRVVGIDITERMIDRSKGRARREGVEDKVEFRVADVQKLPFKDSLFDAVIGESVIAFVEDKRRAVKECVRVTRSGGYVGFNEGTWMKTPPPRELVEYLFRTTGSRLEGSDVWKELLEGSGLRDIVVRTYETEIMKEYINRIRQTGLKEFFRTLNVFLFLYIRSPSFRNYAKQMWTTMPLRTVFEYLGYGIYVGRK